MIALDQILSKIMQESGSDIYILPGTPVKAKVRGQMEQLGEERCSVQDCADLLQEIYALAGGRSMKRLEEVGDDDFSFSLAAVGRFRCSAYRQRGSYGAVLRAVPFSIPDAEKLHIPKAVMDLFSLKRGMVLVTGPADSGKSTTLACLIDRINRERTGHIITIEDPIEYLHGHKGCLVSQREINTDTLSFAHALRAALRQAPDVILLGEMRDFETISTAMTASETGHLLLSTLHTVGAAKTIDRIVDVFPANQQQQVRVQLSMVLQAVVSQQLLPRKGGHGRAAACEVMVVNSAIRNLIREGKTPQIDSFITMSAQNGSITMDNALLKMVREGVITMETARSYARDPEAMDKMRRY